MYNFSKMWRPVYEEVKTEVKTEVKPEVKTFTQEQVNKMLAEDRRRHMEKNTTLMDEIAALKAKESLTSDERKQLEDRNEELRKANMTAEQLKKEETTKIRTELQGRLDIAAKERDDWKTRFSSETINRAIVDAAAAHTAYVPAQLVAILKPQTRLVEAVDSDGKPTGEYTPKVSFEDTKEGKPVTLELTPAEAVKRMTEMDEHLNLFKGKGSGGIGKTNKGSGGGGIVTVADAAKSMSPGEYQKWRKENELG